MLQDLPIHATIPAADLDRANRFYTETLGFTAASEDPGGIFFDCAGGTRFLLYPSGGAGTGQHTLVGFQTPDIEREVADLRSRGAVFEEYDVPGLRTEDGIAQTGDVRAAWFKDTEGNILGVVELPS